MIVSRLLIATSCAWKNPTLNFKALLRKRKPMTRSMKKISLYFVLLTLFAPMMGASAANRHLDTTKDASDRSLSWSIAGPMGGDVRELVVDPSNPQHLYLGTIDGQIYQSTDGARTWSRLSNFNRPGIYIDHIIVDPRDPKIIYVAAHRHKEPGGFFKSTDGGETWREASELKTEALHSLLAVALRSEHFDRRLESRCLSFGRFRRDLDATADLRLSGHPQRRVHRSRSARCQRDLLSAHGICRGRPKTAGRLGSRSKRV
jgi:hypothetical protein